MLKQRKMTLPLNSLFSLFLMLFLVGCGEVDNEFNEFGADTHALEAASSDEVDLDEDVIEFASTETIRCPYQRGGSFAHRCEEQCSGSSRSWDEDNWSCTITTGNNPYDGFIEADQVRIVDRALGSVDKVRCPWQEGSSKAHQCAEQCSGTNRSWDADTWICTVTNGVDPYDDSIDQVHVIRSR